MSYIKIHGIYYHLQRAGQGEPLVLLHGFTGSGQSWEQHRPYFERSYSVITLDLPGHGSTESPADPARYAIDATARDLIALFDWLLLRRVHLLGYSMGGRVALYLAAHYPNRLKSLILVGASPGIADPAERAARAAHDRQLAGRIEQSGIEAFIDYWENLPLFASQRDLPAAERIRLREARLRNNPLGLGNSLRGLSTGVQPSLWHMLDTLEMPTLLMAGALDTKFVGINQQMAQKMPCARLAIIPGAGHMPQLEQPLHFQRAALDFLARADADTLSP